MFEKKAVGTALSLWKGEDGAIISAELVLVMTIAVLAMIVGLKSVSDAVNAELEDVAEAFGAISQSFDFQGVRGCNSVVSGSSFDDGRDEDACDCVPLDYSIGHVRTPDKCE